MTTSTRTVITRSGSRIRGWYPSLKSNSLIEWESQLELDFLRLLEFLQWVTRFRAYQQLVLVHHSQGSFKAYPDFALTTRHGTCEEIAEVKSDRDLAKQEIAERLDLIRQHYQQNGISYRVWSETEIRREPRYSNVKELIRYRRPGYRKQILAQSRCQGLLKVRGEISFADASQHVGGSDTAYRMLAHNLFTCDLNARLSPTMPIRVH